MASSPTYQQMGHARSLHKIRAAVAAPIVKNKTKGKKQMKAPTKTQKQIAQELVRRGYEQKVTKQTEYLKFQHVDSCVLWVGRTGEIRVGRRFPRSFAVPEAERQAWKREARKNYVGS